VIPDVSYDSSRLAMPTDEVDLDQLARPARWNIAFIRRFMLYFGPTRSVFLATFAIMLWGSTPV
jgi:Mg2+-importing ATPase